MEKIASLSKEICNKLQNAFERKASLEELCLMFASNNKLFDQNSHLYERIINDFTLAKKDLQILFNHCSEEYGISKGVEFYVDFDKECLYLK